MARQAERIGGDGSRSAYPGSERCDHRGDHDQHLRSDLHLYELLSPFMTAGDILGHEPMGIVREIGSDVAISRWGTVW